MCTVALSKGALIHQGEGGISRRCHALMPEPPGTTVLLYNQPLEPLLDLSSFNLCTTSFKLYEGKVSRAE